MKKKIQHNAVNNQEDEDSCAYPICLPGDASVEKIEDKPDEESNGQVFNEESGNKGESTGDRE